MTEVGSHDQREKEIIEFITMNPGVSEQKVRDSMSLSASVTTHKIIVKLLKIGVLVNRNERPNSRPYRLYLNTESSVLAAIGNLGKFEKAYLSLIRKTKRAAMKEPNNDEILQLMNQAVDTYHHAVQVLISQSIFIWPEEIKDEISRERLLLTVFTKMADIQAEIASEFRDDDDAMSLLKLDFELSKPPPLLNCQDNNWKKYGMAKECAQIVKTLKNMERVS